MPRRPTILQNQFPYSVTSRSNNKDWFDVPMPELWQIFTDKIRVTAERYGFVTHAFLLMSNHYHWLLSTPESNIGSGMRYFNTESSRGIARFSGRINKIFGSRYKPSLITTPIYYANSYRYIYQNPLRAGMCDDVFNYPWSALGSSDVRVSECFGFQEFIPREEQARRLWLNRIPDSVFHEVMRKAMRRTEFKFPAHPTKKTPVTGFEFL